MYPAQSSFVSHAMVMMTRFARTSSKWKANSNACQGASRLYGVISVPAFLLDKNQQQEMGDSNPFRTDTDGYISKAWNASFVKAIAFLSPPLICWA